jgi:transcriptional regulator with XRE-family HTH domain
MLAVHEMADYPPYTWQVFLKRIREVREDKGLSHEACASALGFKDKSQYTKRENGTTAFEIELIDRAREFFGMPRPWPFVPAGDAFLLQQHLRDQEEGRTSTPNAMLAAYLQRHPDVDPELVQEMRRVSTEESADFGEEEMERIRERAYRLLTARHVAAIRLLTAALDRPDVFAASLQNPSPDLARALEHMREARTRLEAAVVAEELVNRRFALAAEQPAEYGRYREETLPELPSLAEMNRIGREPPRTAGRTKPRGRSKKK